RARRPRAAAAAAAPGAQRPRAAWRQAAAATGGRPGAGAGDGAATRADAQLQAFKRDGCTAAWLLPLAQSGFRASHLRAAYQRYSHRQRQRSLIVVNMVDLALKVSLATVFLATQEAQEAGVATHAVAISWTKHGRSPGDACVVSAWACAGCTGKGLGFPENTELVWYVLFIEFVTYALLPLPLRWCALLGGVSAGVHLVWSLVVGLSGDDEDAATVWRKLAAAALLYAAVNAAGMYTNGSYRHPPLGGSGAVCKRLYGDHQYHTARPGKDGCLCQAPPATPFQQRRTGF
ncbi:Adenylate and Guanylate cyclase, partial [Gryllus bimaculatus]